jgi:hypothetical protein
MKLGNITKLAAMVALLAAATTGHAVTLGLDRLLGTIAPGTPADPTNEAEMVNFLIKAYNTSTTPRVLGDDPLDPQVENYTLTSGSSIPAGPLALATTIGDHNVSTSNTTFSNAAGYTWVTAKFGQDAEVFYIGGLTGNITLSDFINRNGLSGYTLFNAAKVPDGGATATLIGMGIMSLGLIRRKIS